MMFCFRRHSYRRETKECISRTDETNAKAAKGFITVLFHVHQILVVRHEDIQAVAVNSTHIFWQLRIAWRTIDGYVRHLLLIALRQN